MWKYAGALSLLICALLVASGALGAWFAWRESLAAVQAQQSLRAQAAAQAIDAYVARIRDAMRSVVDKLDHEPSAAPQGPLRPPAPDVLRIELASLLRHHLAITEVHWIDERGVEQASQLRYGLPPPRRDWSVDPLFIAARASAGAATGPVYFRKGSEPFLTMAVASDHAGSALVAELSLGFVREALLPGKTTWVVDAAGQLLAHPDLSLVLRRSPVHTLPQVRRAFGTGASAPAATAADPGEARSPDGTPVVSAAAPVPAIGWMVFAEEPLAEALRPVWATLWRSLALIVVGVLLALAASVVLARRLVRPIGAIEQAARRLAAGDWGGRITIDRDDELASLARQFNHMAASLHEAQAVLERRVAERTHDLAAANDAKTRLLAVASHDLRQPIHALALLVGQWRSGAPPGDPAVPVVRRIERSVQSLQALTDALLDLSQLEVGAIQAVPRAFALGELTARLAVQLAPSAIAKGIGLDAAPSRVWVHSDPLLLERILLNLLGNALHHTTRGRILVGVRRRPGDEAELFVADTGSGIEAEHLPRVFDEFYRARGPGASGLGLGLSIVRRLATLLGHRVAIRSAPGRGTCVGLRLPRVPPPSGIADPMRDTRAQNGTPEAPGATFTSPPVDPLQGARVLLVDDDGIALEAARQLLTGWGCTVVPASGYEQALHLAREQAVDVVLTDLLLNEDARAADGASTSRHDGLALIDALHLAGGGITASAAAIITGAASHRRAVEARALGIAVLNKPTAPARLRALIDHLVRASRRDRWADVDSAAAVLGDQRPG